MKVSTAQAHNIPEAAAFSTSYQVFNELNSHFQEAQRTRGFMVRNYEVFDTMTRLNNLLTQELSDLRGDGNG